jgi:hypothetical protein
MAIFIQNTSNNVFAGASTITPDFDRIEKILKTRQNKYDEGAKKVKSLYDSVFNSSMLRDGNIQRRDEYLKTITESLNNISAMDLSLPENQQFASTLFTPVLTDAAIIKDMSYTKAYQTQLSEAEALRTSTDPETRKRYWDIGKRALQYQAEEFKNANDETALGMSNPVYSQQVDLQTIAQKAFKDSGISVKEDVINGGYIFTKKNGQSVFPVAQSYVETLFSTDPAIVNMFRTRAYVQRKDFMKANAAKFGSEEKAEAAYLSDILTKAGYGAQQKFDKENLNLKQLETKKESWDKIIRERGIVPGSAEHDEYLTDLEKLKVAKQTVDNMDKSFLKNDLDFNNINEVRQEADGLTMLSNYTNSINEVARKLAMINAEVSVKEDPISLAHLRSDLALRNSKIMANINYQYKLRFLEEEVAAGKYSDDGGSSTRVADRQKVIDELKLKQANGTITETELNRLNKLEEKNKKEKKDLNSPENTRGIFENPLPTYGDQSTNPGNSLFIGTYDPLNSQTTGSKLLELPTATNQWVGDLTDSTGTSTTNIFDDANVDGSTGIND